MYKSLKGVGLSKRAEEKQQARDEDLRKIRSGEMSAKDVNSKNSLFKRAGIVQSRIVGIGSYKVA